MRANDLSKFTFYFRGYGHYLVTYTTERGDYYKALVTDMTLIDATKNAEHAKIRDIKALRSFVVRFGAHYHKDGTHF